MMEDDQFRFEEFDLFWVRVSKNSKRKKIILKEINFDLYHCAKHDLQEKLYNAYEKGLFNDQAYFYAWKDHETAKQMLECI